LGAKPPALGDFCKFSIKITHFYAYFDQNNYFKAITHQINHLESSLNVLSSINKVQFIVFVRINVTKYDVTFVTKGGF